MKKEEAGEGSSIRTFIRGVYKAIGFQVSELKTRLLSRTRTESWSVLVFENGIQSGNSNLKRGGRMRCMNQQHNKCWI